MSARTQATRAGLRIAGAFLIFGCLWILLSDHAIAVVAEDSESITQLQTLKGWAFVLGTALLLFFMVVREMRARLDQEERFRRLAEKARDLIYRYRLLPDQAFEYVSPAAERITGYTPEDHSRDPELGLRIVHPEDRHLLHALAEGKTDPETPLVLRWVRKDGKVVWIEQRNVPVFDAEGRLTAIEGIARDITEQRLAERALVEERTRLRKIAETSPVGITVLDDQGRILFGNPIAEKLLGLTRSELTGQSYNAPGWAITSLDGGPFPDADLPFRKVAATLEPVFGVQHAIRWPDGRRVFLSINAAPLLDHKGAFEGMVASMEDITEQIKTTQSLHRSREEYRLLFENAISGVATHEILLDASGKPVDYVFLDVNPAFERLTGLKASDVVGRRVTEVLPGIEGSSFIKVYGEVALTGVPAVFEQFSEPLNKHFMIHAYQVKEGRFATAFEDVTDRLRGEENRRHLERQLGEAQKMEAIGRLAGGIAHDFNNMLAVIMSAAEMAIPQVDPKSAVFQDLMQISQAAERSADLTRQLLAFSRRQVIRPRPTDLNQVVTNQERILRRLIGEEIEIRLGLRGGLWNVFIDPSQIDQILANLMVNARDSIEGTGNITVDTDNVHLDESHSREDMPVQEGDFVLLSITDTGSGMDAETLEHIFEPFFTTKGQGEGTGLGLSTVYGIVKQNNGVIHVYSEPGMGTTVKVYLPRHMGDAEGMGVEVEGPLTGTETILVVEDEESILMLAHRFLQDSGYRVLTARNPMDALETAQEYDGPIHLLLTDVVMPGMNGRQLQVRLKELRPEVRTLFMSGYTANVIAHRGVLEDGVDFIQKPFTMRTLTRRVREILDAGGKGG